MPTDLPLHPDIRSLYGGSLRPPPGTVFDAGVATTFTLDIETALAIPVTLALFGSEDRDELLQSPLALLEGLERTADLLAIFCEAGRIQAQPAPQSRLCTLLERLITEVTAPRGGSFHPKLSVLCYLPLEAGKTVRIRLLFMRDYALKRAIRAYDGKECPAPLLDAIKAARRSSLTRRRIREYRPLTPPNGRMRLLMADVFGDDLDQRLWIPPSLPYYGDGDSGELVFPHDVAHSGLVRLPDVPTERRIALMAALIERHRQALEMGDVVTIRGERIRISRPPSFGIGRSQ